MEECGLDRDLTCVVQRRLLKDQERAWRSTFWVGFQFRQTTRTGGILGGTGVGVESEGFDGVERAGHRVNKLTKGDVSSGVKCTSVNAMVGFIAMEDDESRSRLRGTELTSGKGSQEVRFKRAATRAATVLVSADSRFRTSFYRAWWLVDASYCD